MIVFIWMAAAAALVTFYVHTFIGGPLVAGPLLADENLPPESKWLNYYCWHITTVLLAFLAAGFAWLAIHPHLPPLVFLGTLSIALSILSAAVALKAKISPLRLPSTSLFALIGTLSVIAIATR